ncbi:condensation domain-containing protein, partial [Oribacterium sp. NK2B42]|uniref:condensation domain-containing protein n=1 Tax=Oribacterium sp. NK2B42 TaxID=689781 RepID=UPI0005D189AD
PVIEVTIEEIVPAENEMQEKILDIAKEVIGTEKTGITTDLFMVGLSSIGCIKLCSLLSDAFDVNIKVAEIFECKNVKSIEALVNEKRDSGENTVSYELRESYPLTKTQMGIYVDSEVYEGTTVYNIPILYSLDPNVDLERLRDAIIKTFLAHPYLFMTLCDENGVIRAVRNQPEVFDIQIKDVMPELDDLVYPFDLTAGKRLFRVELFDTAKGKYFFVDIHHIVFDGWSLSVLRDDINRAYSGENVPVEKYTGYEAALDEEVALKTDRHGKAKAFYDSVFLGCGGETMPVKDGKFTESKIEYSEYTGEKNADEVRDCCIKNGVSLNAFFTAAFGMALQTYTASEEVIFSTIYNGRNDSRVENSISMFVKTMPVRLEFIAEDSVRDTLKKCQNYLLSAMANDIYSFAEISKAYGIGADILFAFQGEESGSMTIGGYPSKEIELPLSQTMAPFDVDVYLIGNKIVYKAAIDPNVYSSYTINGFLKLFDRIVSGFIEKETIGDIELVSEEDKKDILNLHDTKFTVKEKPAYRLLQDSAEKNPDKVALVAVDRTLIYRELNEEANAVGHALIAEARKVRTGLIADSGHGP